MLELEDGEVDLMEKAKMEKGHEECMLKACAEILMRAEEIKADTALMKKLEPYIKKKIKVLESIADLKKAYSDGQLREKRKEAGY